MIVGIDPGIVGAACVLSRNRKVVYLDFLATTLLKNGKNELDIPTIYACLQVPICFTASQDPCSVIGVIEKVGATPQMGVTSSFRFGEAYGSLKTMLELNCSYTRTVSSQKWKKHFNLTKDKEAARHLAIKLYPEQAQNLKRKKDKDKAEALLIATYMLERLEHERD